MDPYFECYQADEDEPAGWAWVGLLILVGVLEWVLPRTLSQFTQGKAKKWLWFKIVGVLAFALLTWHLFWGFPGGRKKVEAPADPPVLCGESCY